MKKTILIVDDEQGFIEALEDALIHEGYQVLKASSVENALQVLKTTRVDLVTVDIMLPQGKSLESSVASHRAGLFLCSSIKQSYPQVHMLCISVVSDPDIVRNIQDLGVRFLRKGETPLRTVLAMIKSKLGGLAYTTG